MMTKKNTLWYLRQQKTVKGPFPSAIIINHIVLGRLSLQDEVSTDKVNWQRIIAIPELHPDSDSADKTQQLRRQLDERTGTDRRDSQQDSPHAATRGEERRAYESAEVIRRRQFHGLLMKKFKQDQPSLVWPLALIFSTLMLIALLAIFFPKLLPVPLPNCSNPPAQLVNWNNCLKPDIDLSNLDLTAAQFRNSQMKNAKMMNTTLMSADLAYADLAGSDMSYSDLRKATLIGANLEQADLAYANLRQADLAYTDLSQANLGGSALEGARLDHAIWIDGRQCAEGSIGRCIFVQTQQ